MESLYNHISSADVAWLPPRLGCIATVMENPCYEVFQPHFSDGEEHAATLFLEEDIAAHIRRLRRWAQVHTSSRVQSKITQPFFSHCQPVEQAAILFAVFNAMGVLHAWPLHAYLRRLNLKVLDVPQRKLVQACRRQTPKWDVNKLTPWGDLALHLVAANGHPDLIQDLIASGAHVRAIDGRGRSLLHCLAMGRDGPDMARKLDQLTSADMDINHQDDTGFTALHDAVQRKCVDVTRWLLERGADITLKNQDGKQAQDLIGMIYDDNHAPRQRQLVELFQATLLNKEVDRAKTAASRSRL